MRVAAGLRLGLNLCAPHRCQCGEVADQGALTCRRSVGRAARHAAINDIIWRALSKAGILSSKEPPGLIRTDGKRPDGATLIPWSKGRLCCMGRYGNSYIISLYIHLTALSTGGASERKRTKYANRTATHDFIPLAIESLGPINITGMEFLQDLGQRITERRATPVKRPTCFSGCLSARSTLTPWPSGGRLNSALQTRSFHSITVLHSHMAAICKRQRCLVLKK